ncbi:hypothetical protein ACNOYE_03670 [Nannocystaceae bacterium ST9]
MTCTLASNVLRAGLGSLLASILALPSTVWAAPPPSSPSSLPSPSLPDPEIDRPARPKHSQGAPLAIVGFMTLAGFHIGTAAGFSVLDVSPQVRRSTLVPVVGPFVAIGYVRAEPSLPDDDPFGFAAGFRAYGADVMRAGLGISGVLQVVSLSLGVAGTVMIVKDRRRVAELGSGPGGLLLRF